MNELNVRNRTIFHGDNLEFLRGINSETIHLIATDPPFKKGRDFHATPGSLAQGAGFKDRWSWEQDVQGDWVDKIKDDWPAAYAVIESTRLSYGEDMSAFLCWLGVRIMEMHRVLRQDGSLYLHIDHTAHAYVKALLDSIFGARNFRNEIVWQRIKAGKQSGHRSTRFSANTDSILFYVKSKQAYVHPYRELTDEEMFKKFPLVDENGERYYDDSSHIFRPPGLGPAPNLCYEWRGFKNPHPSGWTMRKFKLEEEYQKGNYVIKPNGKLQRRKYARDYRGLKLSNLWYDIYAATGNERTGYPTQKPLALYERIIKASSNEGDFVLDPFCGCATTPIAAERLKRQWIGMDIWDGALEQVQNRLVRDTILRFDDQQHHVTLPKVY